MLYLLLLPSLDRQVHYLTNACDMFGIHPSTLLLGGLIAFLAWFVRFATTFRKQRAFYKDVPCPPHDFWWGHMKLVGQVMRELPPKFHFQQLMAYIGQKYNMPGVFYLDMWPASYPIMMIHDPGVANQITVTQSLPKHPVNARFLGPLAGKKSIVLVEGAEWKTIRSTILPGFAPQYLSTLQPIINKHIGRFKEKLSSFVAGGESFPLQDPLISLAIDLISEIVLGFDLNSQKSDYPEPGELAYHFRKANSWAGSSIEFLWFQISKIPKWYHTRHQDRLIIAMMKERYTKVSKAERGRAAIDLFLQAYENDTLRGSQSGSAMDDPAFMEIAVDNVKSLLLGGHDTTASTTCYTIALLSQNRDSLAKLRTEHDQLLGHDTTRAAEIIAGDPSLLKKLPYTTACIKEAMRIFAPASTTRSAGPGTIQSVTFEGRQLPITGQQMWISHYGIGQRADIWPQPHSYIPERHMPNGPHEIVKDAWRGFEKGPRACLGMELAMNEIKTTLVSVMRDFDFEVAYPENVPRAPEAFGGPMYQVIEMAAKPTLHMPVRVRRRI